MHGQIQAVHESRIFYIEGCLACLVVILMELHPANKAIAHSHFDDVDVALVVKVAVDFIVWRKVDCARKVAVDAGVLEESRP